MKKGMMFIFGYRRLRLRAASLGELMNIFRAEGYVYRDLEFCGDYVCLCCSAAVSGHVIELCAQRGISVCVEGEVGIPYLLKRYRHRYGVFIGLALAAVIVFMSGFFVWDIRVEGNGYLSDEEVIAELSECGFSVGTRKKGLDIGALENRVLILSEKISWISVNITGTVASVEIREVEEIPKDDAPKYAAANLIASRGGVIEELCDVRGEVVAKVGDIVGEGDLLVSGLYGDERAPFRYVCASGRVMARTQRHFEEQVPLEYTEKVYSEGEKCEKFFIFFKKEVKFTINSRNLPPKCDTINTVEYFCTPWGTELPFGIRTVRYYGYTEETRERSEEEAERLAEYLLRARIFSETDNAELVSERMVSSLEDGVIKIKCTAEYIENIAIVKEIEIEGLPS